MKSIDVLAFQSWLIAYAEGKTKLQDFYRKRFRPEFSVAFGKWFKEEPLLNADATPLQRPEYRLESAERAMRLETEAARIFAEGETASDRAEQYSSTPFPCRLHCYSRDFQSRSARCG